MAALTWRRQGKTASIIIGVGIMMLVMRDENYDIGLVPNIISSALEFVDELMKLLKGLRSMFPDRFGDAKFNLNKNDHRLRILWRQASKGKEEIATRFIWTSSDKDSGRGKKFRLGIGDEVEFADKRAIENSLVATMGQAKSATILISTPNPVLPSSQSVLRNVLAARNKASGKPLAINASLATFCEKHRSLRYKGYFCCACNLANISPRINTFTAENVAGNFFGRYCFVCLFGAKWCLVHRVLHLKCMVCWRMLKISTFHHRC